MQIHIITTTDSYRYLLKKLGIETKNYLNTMDWYELDNSKSITIAKKKFKVNSKVNDSSIYMVRKFRIKRNPTIWLKPYTFPDDFWMTQSE